MCEDVKIYYVDPDWLSVCIFSRISHYHLYSICAHIWAAHSLPWWKGLWLSLSLMWRLPIGLACWRGNVPQGQLRHNVSLSGCYTGQWQRVSHRRPTHPWAAALPSSCRQQWKRECGAGNEGWYSQYSTHGYMSSTGHSPTLHRLKLESRYVSNENMQNVTNVVLDAGLAGVK